MSYVHSLSIKGEIILRLACPAPTTVDASGTNTTQSGQSSMDGAALVSGRMVRSPGVRSIDRRLRFIQKAPGHLGHT